MNSITLREARYRAHLTQDDLAAKSGIDQTTISRLETNPNAHPGPNTIAALAKALRIAASRLTFGASRAA